MIYVWVKASVRALTDLLPALRSGPLDEPLDLRLLGFGDALQEGGVALNPEQDLLHHPSTDRT